MPRRHGKCVCMPSHGTIISPGAMVLLRALTTARSSPRLPISHYQTFSEIIFSPSASDVIRATFQPASRCHRLGGLLCPSRELKEQKEFNRDGRSNPPCSRAAPGAAPAGHWFERERENACFVSQESIAKLIFTSHLSSFP